MKGPSVQHVRQSREIAAYEAGNREIDPPQRAAAHGPAGFGYGAIILLMLANVLSMADRQILGILGEQIKRDLSLSDKQLGLLIGLSFALFYTIFGLIISYLLERHHRARVMSLCLAGWSICTALCGAVRSFGPLLATRLGVAVGEAGCYPAAQSMIADYVPMHRRASAMSILVAGSPLGVLLGLALGGIVSQHFGWHAAFFVAAAPGVLLSAILWFAVPDPLRAKLRANMRNVSILEGLGTLRRIPALWLITSGVGMMAFGIYAQGAFLASFYLRNHGVAVAHIAGRLGPSGFLGLMLGLTLGLCGVIGTLTGGRLADQICRGDIGRYMLMAMVSAIITQPLFLAAILVSGFWHSFAFLVPATLISYLYNAPAYTAAVSLAPQHLRATASAVTLLMVNLIGLGLGPITVGTLSDVFAASLGSGEGLRTAFAISPIAGLFGAALFWLAHRHQSSIQP